MEYLKILEKQIKELEEKILSDTQEKEELTRHLAWLKSIKGHYDNGQICNEKSWNYNSNGPQLLNE